MMGWQCAGWALTACATITGFEVPPTAPRATASLNSAGTPESFHQSAPSAVIAAMREEGIAGKESGWDGAEGSGKPRRAA